MKLISHTFNSYISKIELSDYKTAAGNGISDITPVTKLVKMDTLNLAENEITSLDAV